METTRVIYQGCTNSCWMTSGDAADHFHKYWYDILAGFKSELLTAYIVTLMFLLLWNLIKSVGKYHTDIEDQGHIENMAEIANDKLRIENGIPAAVTEEE